MRCVVTGGTGYLGSRLVERLEENGEEVRVVSRSRGADITRRETLEPLFAGANRVYHLAALVQSRPGPFEEINVRGLENVLELCRQEGVERLIYVSSFTIFGPSREAIHSEKSVPSRARFFHGYDRSKYEGFRLAEQWRRRLPLNIVFPGVIYGPGPLTEGNLIARLLGRWSRLHVAPLPRGGRPLWNFVFREDVVQGLLRVPQAEPGEDFILGGENCSLDELRRTFARLSGRRVIPISLPDSFFRLGAHLEDWGSRLAGFTPLMLPHTVDFFFENWQFSHSKAASRLGYAPRTLEEGLRSTCPWLKERRLI